MDRGMAVGLLVVVAVVTTTVAPAGAASGGGLGAPAEVDPDAVQILIHVQPNGTAEWQLQYRVRLTTNNETAAFEDLKAAIDRNPSTYVDRFARRINGTVATAENQTGREMRATDFAVSASVRELTQTYGVLTYTFTWQGFAATEGRTVRIGDALRGFFLDSETSLMITWPSSYTATTVEPRPTSRRDQAVTWTGPLEFVTGEPLVVIEPAQTTTTATTTTGGVPATSDDGTFLIVGAVVAVIAAVLVLVWYLRSRRERDGGTPPTAGREGPGNDGGAGASAPAATDTEPSEELLSNEERVTRFLRDHGGRAKQQEIVDGLDWTEAKTSQVLSSMAEEGSIDKFRIGRENVVKLPTEDESE